MLDLLRVESSSGLFWALLTVAVELVGLAVAGHAILNKRDSRAAAGWVGLILLAPGLGSLLYLVFGINRIRRAAASLSLPHRDEEALHASEESGDPLATAPPHLVELSRAIGSVTGTRLRGGNHIEPLDNGDVAYPRMLAAIDGAQRVVCLSTYIFETRGVGTAFIEALSRAHERGVEVRVLIDAIGTHYARPRADTELRRRGVPVALFMPPRSLGLSRFFNLRNHRKLLVVDGTLAFTGGMNIRAGHVLAEPSDHPVRDIHFALKGPVCGWFMLVFADDWQFAHGERLEGEPWFVPIPGQGAMAARGIEDGPDADLDKFRWALLNGISSARESIRVVTPYFLPDAPLLSALEVAAMRGVRVDVVLPAEGNLKVVQWASQALLQRREGSRVRYWLTPPPFDHAKLLVVDSAWCLFGSANWDPRSLRLNFEIGVECYDRGLATGLAERIDQRIATAASLDPVSLAARPAWMRLRDGIAWLFQPYL